MTTPALDARRLAEAQAVLRENGCPDFPTPWIGHTARNLSEHPGDPYSDVMAFDAWMRERTRSGPHFVDGFSFLDRLDLYGLMHDEFYAIAVAQGWKAPTSPAVMAEGR